MDLMKYVIIGNGVAGTTGAATIRKFDPEGNITVITDETYPYYSRIRLIDFLAGEIDEKGLVIRKPAWYEENRITLLLSTAVTGINSDRKTLAISSGGDITYDRLLLATGGVSFVPPIPGANKKGVFTLRTLQDAITIRNLVKQGGRRIILIGGGVLGLEVGNSLRKAGNHITVVEFFPRLLPRQMDPDGAVILKKQMEHMGFTFYLGATSKEISGKDRAETLVLDDGSRIECEMIIISAGVRANLGLSEKLGLPAEKGVIVNDRMETDIRDIYAAGDLIQHNGIYYGIWPAAEKQGEVAGANMAGGNLSYEGTVVSNMLKVAGVDLVAAGDIDPEGKKESIIAKNENNYIYKKLVLDANTVTGAILYGDVKDSRKIIRLIDSKRDISGIRKKLEQWDFGAIT